MGMNNSNLANDPLLAVGDPGRIRRLVRIRDGYRRIFDAQWQATLGLIEQIRAVGGRVTCCRPGGYLMTYETAGCEFYAMGGERGTEAEHPEIANQMLALEHRRAHSNCRLAQVVKLLEREITYLAEGKG